MTEVHWAGREAGILADEDVRRAVEAARRVGGRTSLEVAVTFVEEEHLSRLHATHLGDPAPTDVITFDLSGGGRGPDGELYVSVERAREVAGGRGVPLERELTLYVVHGVLHLCGLDDQEPADRARMRVAEQEVLAELGFPPDTAPHDMEVD